jgi:hypothetical protein
MGYSGKGLSFPVREGMPALSVEQRTPACCKNGFKWYLFAFYDLKAILSATVSPIFFAVSAFFKSTEVFEFLKGQADNDCIRVSEGQGNFLFYLRRQRVRKDGPSRTISSFFSLNDHSLAFQLGNVQAQSVV